MMEKKLIIDKAFEMIEKTGWENFSIVNLSKIIEIDFLTLKKHFSSKNSIIIEFSRMIDLKVEKLINLEELKETSVKDNLFELLMIRFESMTKYRNGLREIIKSDKVDPFLLKNISKNVINSLDFYLEISNAYTGNYLDIVKKNSIFLIYCYVFNFWLDDDSSDLSKTMVKLDKTLSLSEKILKRVDSLFTI